MPMFNLHLFDRIKTEWDRLYGVDGGLLQRSQESRLEAFLKIYDPENKDQLNAEVEAMLRPMSIEAEEETKQLKLEKLPEVCYLCVGSRLV